MDGGRKLPKADKFIKKHKKLKLWHRLVIMAGSVVVFITTYMLILPAITAEVGTLDLFDESVSSGSSVVVEAPVDNGSQAETDLSVIEISSEEAVSESTEADSVLDNTPDDGVTIDITLEKMAVEEEKEENKEDEVIESFFARFMNAVAEVADEVSVIVGGAGENGSYLCTYDPETGDFKVDLKMDFTIPQSALSDDIMGLGNDYSKSYTINLPSSLIVPEKNIGNWYDGYQTGTNSLAFKYMFEPVTDVDGNIIKYKLKMVFLKSFIDGLGGSAIEGTVKLNGYISHEAYQKDGTISVTDEEKRINIDINSNDIKFEDNQTINRDIWVNKSGSYSASDGTISYTVTVLTQKGAGDYIKITDTFINTSFLESLGAELNSVTYKKGVVGFHEDQYGLSLAYNNTVYTEEGTVSNSSAESINYQQDSAGNITINLPGLEGLSESETGDYYANNNYYQKVNAYVITYTYKVNPKSGNNYVSENKAVAEIKDTVADIIITDEATAKVEVRGDTIITKGGAFNTAANQIDWSITAGDGNNSLAGSVVKDDMFSYLTDADIKAALKGSDGQTASESDYTILKENDKIIGIQFNEGSGAQYTLTYSTSVTIQWKSYNVTNTVTITDDGGGTYSSTASVTVPGINNCFDKTLGNVTENPEGSGIYILPWTTTFNVPESGIPKDVTFTDCVFDNVSSGEDHYITYDQATAIIQALKTAWGEDNITDIQFYTGYNKWDMRNELWVDAAQVSADVKYYQFRYTIKNPIPYNESGSNVITYTYNTTANTNATTNYTEYYNKIGDGNIEKGDDKWSYRKRVVKYGCDSDGNTKSDNSSITITDGKVRWIVRIAVDSSISDYTITDDLPAGVTLSKLYASKEITNNYIEVGTAEGGSTPLFDNGVTLTYSSSGDSSTGQIVTLGASVDSSIYTEDYLYLKYECTINDSMADVQDKAYTNVVNVTTTGNKPYDSSSNTMKVTWTEETPKDDKISKEASFDENNSKIQYSIDINPDGIMYKIDESSEEEFSDLNIVDILKYNSNPSSGFLRDASLIDNSIKLYYAETDSNGKGVRGLDGKLVNSGVELDPLNGDCSWFCSVEVADDWAKRTTKYINLTVPNGTPIIFQYEYVVKIIAEGDSAGWETKAEVENSAELYINGTKIGGSSGTKIDNVIEYNGTEGDARGGAGYTIYKVDKDNFAFTLNGAVFDLYVYNTDGSAFEKVDSYTTSGGKAGIVGVPDTDITQYTITKSDGTTTYNIPVNTMCYFVESSPPSGYKLDQTKYYFYFGQTAAVTAGTCAGYSSEMSSARNVIIPYTEYIKNEHSPEYFAEKTNITVVKKWWDALGNDITESKADGSVKFKLMRVFTPLSGDGSGGGSGDDPVVPVPSDNITWTAVDKNNNIISSGSIPKNSPAEFEIQFSFNSWKPYIIVTDADNKVLAYNKDEWNGGVDGVEVTDNVTWDSSGKYTVTLADVGAKDIQIKLGFNTNENTGKVDGTAAVALKGAETSSETTTEAATEASSETTTEAVSEETSQTVIHYYNFTEYKKNNPDDTDIGYDKWKTYTSDDGCFEIYGNLSESHGTAPVNIDGSEETLTVCLKMQTNTQIIVNAPSDGVLTLVFNEDGNGSESTSIINNCQIDGETYSAVGNVIKTELKAGEHIIKKKDTCYLFYMSFEEGADLQGLGAYKHSFNNARQSTFYTITGSAIASDKGTVTYKGEDISSCFKMNSKAEITFTAPREGTLYILITNPNNASKVGVNMDGEDHYAVKTAMTDSNGNSVYLLPIRVSKGDHSIKRINGTEIMIYYLEYTPDDDSFEDAPILGETNIAGAVAVDAEGKEDADAVHTISAANGWVTAFPNLPWQVIDANGKTTGYYSYYVVEIDNENYITKYKNNVNVANMSEGISSGTIGIYNQDTENNTSLTVIKKWLDIDGNDVSSAHSNDIVEFNLYRKINLNDGAQLNTKKTEAHIFDNYNSSFYTISSNHDPYNDTYGYAVYNGTKYTSCLKTESATSIKFTAPANGTLTLVFGSQKASGTTFANKIGFNLIHNGSTTVYTYDLDTQEVSGDNCQVTYSDNSADSGTVFVISNLEAGDYEIKRASSVQCFLFYMDYTYKLADAAGGSLVGSYTLQQSDTDTAGNSWTKVIDGLFLDIRDDNNNTIGYYSYYIEETSPSSGFDTVIVYSQQDGDPNTVYKDITAGSATITNTEKVEGYRLPETGGSGANKYILAGLLLSLAAALLLYKRHGKFLT